MTRKRATSSSPISPGLDGGDKAVQAASTPRPDLPTGGSQLVSGKVFKVSLVGLFAALPDAGAVPENRQRKRAGHA
jgi:hypothetical protein